MLKIKGWWWRIRAPLTVDDSQPCLVKPRDAMVLKEPDRENSQGQEAHIKEQVQAVETMVQGCLGVQGYIRGTSIHSTTTHVHQQKKNN